MKMGVPRWQNRWFPVAPPPPPPATFQAPSGSKAGIDQQQYDPQAMLPQGTWQTHACLKPQALLPEGVRRVAGGGDCGAVRNHRIERPNAPISEASWKDAGKVIAVDDLSS
ncbi:hypothetical protein GCM10023213_05680 [Prosthecobacter algae]|uniref:Uncharacterized protein n=1 Tax=Prosthecobacter algae TaxID=1144682 RepID=A0ABP9P0L9_9BACT